MNNKKNKILGVVLAVLLCVAAAVVVIVFVLNNVPENPGDGEENSVIDRYTCITVTFGADTTSDANVTWNSITADIGVVQIIEGNAADFEGCAEVAADIEITEFGVPAENEISLANPSLTDTDGRTFRAYITGLKEDTLYSYRVGDGSTWSDIKTFRTASSSDFSFLLLSDTQGFIESDFEIVENVVKSAKNTVDFDFIVHLGDAVEDGDNLYQWQLFFDAIGNYGSIVDVCGNKDKKDTLDHYTNGGSDNRTALVSGYYSFDVSDVHFIVLNTGDGSKDIANSQLKWLKKDLSANTLEKTIVLIHKAPYSIFNHCNDEEIVAIRNQLDPIFEEYNVDIVLEGHDHCYCLSQPLVSGEATAYSYSEIDTALGNATLYTRAGGIGTFFFMNSSAGYKQHKNAPLSSDSSYILASNMTKPTFTIVKVDSEKIIFYTYLSGDSDNDATLFDAWGLCW